MIMNRTFLIVNLMLYIFGQEYFSSVEHYNIENDKKPVFDSFFFALYKKVYQVKTIFFIEGGVLYNNRQSEVKPRIPSTCKWHLN